MQPLISHPGASIPLSYFILIYCILYSSVVFIIYVPLLNSKCHEVRIGVFFFLEGVSFNFSMFKSVYTVAFVNYLL